MSSQSLVRIARLLTVAVAALFVCVIALPRAGDRVAITATAVIVALLVTVLVAAHLRHGVRPTAAGVTAGGALAVAGAELYLLSLPVGGADIPLAGVGILFLGLIALVLGSLTLAPAPASPVVADGRVVS